MVKSITSLFLSLMFVVFGFSVPSNDSLNYSAELQKYASKSTTSVRGDYDIPSKTEVWNNFKAFASAFLKGEVKDSQNEVCKTFLRSVFLRMSERDIFVTYDKDNDLIYDSNSHGLGNIGYDYDCGQGVFYSAVDPWMRLFGYCDAYENQAKYWKTDIITNTFDFNYNGCSYRLQAWKGNYCGVSYGAEIGLYYKYDNTEITPDSLYFCVADKDMIDMEMKVYLDGEYKFTRNMTKSWWLTGFVIDKGVDKERVSVEAEVIMPEEEMKKAFLDSLEKNGFVKGSTYNVEGNTITFKY